MLDQHASPHRHLQAVGDGEPSARDLELTVLDHARTLADTVSITGDDLVAVPGSELIKLLDAVHDLDYRHAYGSPRHPTMVAGPGGPMTPA